VRDATRFSRRHLPEALPANYAWSGNLKRDGDQAFIALFHDLVNGCSISAAFVGAGHPMYVAVYMIAIVALSLIVYFTLPETGSRARRATVAPADPEVLEGEHLTAHGGIQAKGSQP
jgi:hypothetical protein